MATNYTYSSDEEYEVKQGYDREQLIQEYYGEPEVESVNSGSDTEEELEPQRGDRSEWCTCGVNQYNCDNMNAHREKVCCKELDACQDKLNDAQKYYNKEGPFQCITEHPGFIRNCTYWEVLENAWLAYKQYYGNNAYQNENRHKRYRHVAYRELSRLLFGLVGRQNRYILPSCAISVIRRTFPSPDNTYTGYQSE